VFESRSTGARLSSAIDLKKFAYGWKEVVEQQQAKAAVEGLDNEEPMP
jgi:hypothetical protein